MKLDEVLGQERAISQLGHALEQERLAHAMIFAGPPGTGKRTTALALARALLCPDAPGRGCDFCEDCHLLEAGTHPDLLVEDMEKAREERSTASQLSITQVRRLRSSLALQAVRGKRKVAIVEPAEKLGADAQNALLKTLEEPPSGSTLILVCSNPSALLPTIRSRCQTLLFAPLGEEVLEKLLDREGIESPAQVAALADGSLERARQLTGEETRERYDELRAHFDALAQTSIPDLLDLAENLSGGKGDERRRRMAVDTAILLDWARGRMFESVEGGDPDAVRSALARLRRIHGTTRDLEHYANARLSWESLLLDLRRMAGGA